MAEPLAPLSLTADEVLEVDQEVDTVQRAFASIVDWMKTRRSGSLMKQVAMSAVHSAVMKAYLEGHPDPSDRPGVIEFHDSVYQAVRKKLFEAQG